MLSVVLTILFSLCIIAILTFCFCVFFDQALLTRKGTIYRVRNNEKRVALTFDDGPSPIWTPKILDALKEAGVKATFFMIGHHVKQYPEIARRVVAEGHCIGNHGYAHSVLLYYTLPELEEEVKYSEKVIEDITGVQTKYFRPPKAWLRKSEKRKINEMGYQVILWSLNSKDWVAFHFERIVNFIDRRIKSGDIILFHDSGDVFKAEGGDRSQTVLAVSHLVKQLKVKDFNFVTVEELIHGKQPEESLRELQPS